MDGLPPSTALGAGYGGHRHPLLRGWWHRCRRQSSKHAYRFPQPDYVNNRPACLYGRSFDWSGRCPCHDDHEHTRDHGTSNHDDFRGAHDDHSPVDDHNDSSADKNHPARCSTAADDAGPRRHGIDVRSTIQPLRVQLLWTRELHNQSPAGYLLLLQLHRQLRQRHRVHGRVSGHHGQYVRRTPWRLLIPWRRASTRL